MSFTGIGAAFGGFFGASDLEKQFNNAIEELGKYRDISNVSLEGFRTKGQTAFERGMAELQAPTMAPDLAEMRKMLVTQIGQGMSPFAKLQMEDANRFLENKAISSGNLRSGAIGLQRAELGRRVVADEFGRASNLLESLGKRDLAASSMYLQTGLGYAGAENQALASLGGATSALAGAMVGKGAAQQQATAMLGSGIGGVLDMGASYFGSSAAGAGGGGGGVLGGGGSSSSWTGGLDYLSQGYKG